MGAQFAKLSQFKAYKKNPTFHNESNLKGHIYELFCYNRILNNDCEIEIIKSNCTAKKSYGNFSYNKSGKINYHSNGIHLAEFDILGLKNDIIYFFEITKTDQGKKELKKEIERKKELLSRIFPKLKIYFTLILPKNVVGYDIYHIKIIDEPVYEKYLNSECFQLDSNIDRCKTLEYLCNFAENYDYINDIAYLSKKYFHADNKDALHKQHLIERIYDMNNITKNSFSYYSVEKQKYGTIRIENGRFFQDEKIIQTRKKCHAEIKLLKEHTGNTIS